MVTQPEAEAALKVQEAQPKEQGKAEAGSPPRAVLPQWQEPKQGLQQPPQLPMLHTGTTCLKVQRPCRAAGFILVRDSQEGLSSILPGRTPPGQEAPSQSPCWVPLLH